MSSPRPVVLSRGTRIRRWARLARLAAAEQISNRKFSIPVRAVHGTYTRVSRWLGQERIPDPRRRLYVEPSGLCNLRCRFCAYPKKIRGRTIMDDSVFASVVDQALQMGYRTIALTPSTGDVFADRGFMSKLEFLEGHPRLESYAFFTNFILPRTEQVRRLLSLERLRPLSISIYGHDEASFVAMTRANGAAYRRLLANLETVLEHGAPGPLGPHLYIRSGVSFRGIDACGSELCRLLVALRNRFDLPVFRNRWFDNWGGKVSQRDVEGLDIDIAGSELVRKRGACTLIFDQNTVLADGRVNACACRDVEGTLELGKIQDESLSKILSLDNPRYIDLIERQQRGNFDPVCRSCTAYRSIYSIGNPFSGGHGHLTMSEFLAGDGWLRSAGK